MTKDYGIQLAMHIDFLCAVHSMEDIDKLLKLHRSRAWSDLVIDTAS